MDSDDLRRIHEQTDGEYSWSELDAILYKYCEENPRHDNDKVILAKLVLIGRTYAAALERRRDPTESADDFYIKHAAPTLRTSEIDVWLADLGDIAHVSRQSLPRILEVHADLVGVFEHLTHQRKRSLASKYLHFHRPDLFFIYDSRAESAARDRATNVKRRSIRANSSDAEYHLFCERCLAIVENLREKSDRSISPRVLDNLLLVNPDSSGV